MKHKNLKAHIYLVISNLQNVNVFIKTKIVLN